jgi:hypothetical protein
LEWGLKKTWMMNIKERKFEEVGSTNTTGAACPFCFM